VRVGDGRIVTCSPTEHADLFRATIGGMGLTGAILEVSFRLVPIPTTWIYEKRLPVGNLDEFLDRLKEAAPVWPMTVGWIDCLTRGADMGRGVLYCGRWADPSEAPRSLPPARHRVSVPIECPVWTLSPLTIRACNAVNYRYNTRRRQAGVVHPHAFFYPLDAIEHWTRLYGSHGLTQYQCVIPDAAGRDVVRRFFELLTARGGASFLCVIKDCGDEGPGMLSFPRPGTSIALDIPMRADTQALVDALNELLIDTGGRIYLAKDALTRPDHFRAMEPRLDAFLAVRRTWDPQGRVRSAQSVRLFGW
jgi:FAD/FMN-containing dehydrogenase